MEVFWSNRLVVGGCLERLPQAEGHGRMPQPVPGGITIRSPVSALDKRRRVEDFLAGFSSTRPV